LSNYRRLLILLTVLVLLAGWLGMTLAVKQTQEELRSKLMLRAITAATMISYERVERLTATEADSHSPDFAYLREQLIATRALNTDCRFIYLMKKVDDRIVFLLDSEPVSSEAYSPPGHEYSEASDELVQIFSDGQAFVEGPLADAYGVWVSGLASVRNPADGKVVAVLGMDIAGRDWESAVNTTRLIVGGVTLAVLLVIYALLYAQHVSSKAAGRIYLAEKQAKEAVVAVSQAKSDFIAYLSHEIRTPVNGILGLGELLETTLLDRRQRDYISAIGYSAQSLLTVLNEVLDFSKIEANKMTVEKINFAFYPLVEGAINMLRATALSKGLALTLVIDKNIPTAVIGDPMRLQQILLNLVANAIKFTETGKVEITVECLSQEGDSLQAKITVTDTGIGLDQAEINKLFQPFSQVDGVNVRKYTGTGLGLSIAASLIKLMGGEIGVVSRKGQGSAFWFTLPLAIDHADNEPVVMAAANTGRPMPVVPDWLLRSGTMDEQDNPGDVLIVEDNPVIQQVITSQLKHLGLTTELAGNGQEAVKKARKSMYKLIFMDCGLPLLDGMAATRLIREQEMAAGQHTPIIALTGRALAQEQEQCLATGMDDCLVKPVSIQDIANMLARWLPEEKAEIIEMQVLKELKVLADSGQATLDMFIDAYLEELPQLTDKLRQALLDGDAGLVKEVAHSLKSMSGTIGAKRLYEIFGSLEQRASAQEAYNDARRLISQIDRECIQVAAALRNAARLL